MPIGGLNHFNINCVDLEVTRAFYRDVLGMQDGERPPLSFPGAWMYSGGAPTVHLVGPREGDAERPPRRAQPTGQLDHVAFFATGLVEVKGRLIAHGVPFREQKVPRDGQTQLFFHDPNGIGLELNFPPGDGA